MEAGLLHRRYDSEPASALQAHYFGLLRTRFLEDGYPCLGARAATARATLCANVHGRLGDAATVPQLHADLVAYAADLRACPHAFMSYVAVFEGPELRDECEFERLLWAQLQALHDYDAPRHPWDPAVDRDPASPRFAYSVAGTGWFVVGLSPCSERAARRFPAATMVFNSQRQFDGLRARGQYEPLQQAIRERDLRYAGSINPNLADFGDAPAARQYSGRRAEPDWPCPLRIRS